MSISSVRGRLSVSMSALRAVLLAIISAFTVAIAMWATARWLRVMTVFVAVLAAARAVGPIVGSSSLEGWHPLPSSPRGLHRYRPQTVKHTTPPAT